jgi:Skp family chaperone for outer membrane proteins
MKVMTRVSMPPPLFACIAPVIACCTVSDDAYSAENVASSPDSVASEQQTAAQLRQEVEDEMNKEEEDEGEEEEETQQEPMQTQQEAAEEEEETRQEEVAEEEPAEEEEAAEQEKATPAEYECDTQEGCNACIKEFLQSDGFLGALDPGQVTLNTMLQFVCFLTGNEGNFKAFKRKYVQTLQLAFSAQVALLGAPEPPAQPAPEQIDGSVYEEDEGETAERNYTKRFHDDPDWIVVDHTAGPHVTSNYEGMLIMDPFELCTRHCLKGMLHQRGGTERLVCALPVVLKAHSRTMYMLVGLNADLPPGCTFYEALQTSDLLVQQLRQTNKKVSACVIVRTMLIPT